MSKVELLERIIKDFNKDTLIQFYKLSSDQFRPVSEDFFDNLPKDDKRFESIEQIGRIEHEKKAQSIAFFISSVSGEISERDSKKKQYDIGKKILRDNYLDAGIFVFYGENNFRLSLIAASYSGPKRKFTTFKRYTYFVSPELTNKTFKDQLKKCDFSSIEKILEAFSIEAVNKDFYTQIAQKFTDLVGGWLKIGSKKYEREGCLVWPDDSDEKRKEFAVRLIGRLVFCWFLKKKHSEPANIPLVPKDILSLEAANNNDSYYHFVLEPLFFQVLNKKRNDRHKKYKSNGWDKIPFLNGGLFTPHSDDYYNPDDFQGISPRGDVKVPDEWLRELLEIFERYNFTIDENTPVDIEISIDPEMLGRIFENLLAMINPETGETVRKSTGSYYTPRPIVEYMVNQSIKQYLLTQTNIPEENIDSLLSYSDEAAKANLTDKQNDSVIDALDKLKVLDPACGSGAFPMGILQKVLLVLQKVDHDSTKWKTRLLAKIPNTAARKSLAEKLESETWQYIHKLGVIQNSIYGVDIQPIAAEISKLRAFLSLVVDETVNDTAENRGILSLPNLEFKFVCANTLIGLPETESQKGKMRGKKVVEFKGQTSMFEATDDIAELKGVIDNYFTSYGEEKIKLEQQFNEIQSKLRQHMLDSGQTDTQTAKLADWNPFGHDSCPWFDPKWMFCNEDGFDIVIANPPYVQLRDMPFEHQEALRSSPYRKIAKGGRLNVFQFFIPEAIDICKINGIICLITQNSLLGEDSATNCRKHIFSQCKIIEFSSFPERDNSSKRVFEGVKMSVCVSLLKKTMKDDYSFLLKVWQERKMLNHTCIELEKSKIQKLFPDNYQIPLVTQSTYKLLKKIRDFKPAFSVSSSAGEIDMTKYKNLFKPNGRHRVLHGAQVQKFYVSNMPSQGRINYLNSRDISSNTRARELSKSKRIVMQRITGVDSKIRLIMTIVSDKYLCSNSTNYILEEQGYPLEFIIGILNSKLINKYFKVTSTNTNITAKEINSIPLPKTLNYKKIADLVKIIIKKKAENQNSNTSILEAKIDKMVYGLYDLTPEEIAIVENEEN